ncbi:MAG: hypothetical protein Q4615_13695, partial [Paracoccus aminovorans]|nr:hypothetical protein [Paracoccus aminovorans]
VQPVPEIAALIVVMGHGVLLPLPRKRLRAGTVPAARLSICKERRRCCGPAAILRVLRPARRRI